MKTVKEKIKAMNWDNDVIRVLDAPDKTYPVEFSYDRTINSLIEVSLALIEEVGTLQTKIEQLEKKGSKKKTETEPTNA